ncbi:MAG: hypothetical protein B7Y39_06620 [Bdellovibrio sp. 28-41-41]|nr:MAG: hypothetical protein B7Y39_06620 [Bdellovibrio sp. 28-41-41]
MRIEENKDSFEYGKLNYLDSVYQPNLSPEFLALAEQARAESRKLNKEGISIALSEAYVISEQVKQAGCSSYMELGSLTGYSALFLLRGLKSGGTLFCFEKDARCADFIESLFKNMPNVPELAGKKGIVMRGDAKEALANWKPPSDVGGAFIDANKSAYPDYLKWIEAHLKGSYLILADNVFLSGSVWGLTDTPFSKKQALGMIEFNKSLIQNPSYSSYFIATSEGLLVARRKD